MRLRLCVWLPCTVGISEVESLYKTALHFGNTCMLQGISMTVHFLQWLPCPRQGPDIFRDPNLQGPDWCHLKWAGQNSNYLLCLRSSTSTPEIILNSTLSISAFLNSMQSAHAFSQSGTFPQAVVILLNFTTLILLQQVASSKQEKDRKFWKREGWFYLIKLSITKDGSVVGYWTSKTMQLSMSRQQYPSIAK